VGGWVVGWLGGVKLKLKLNSAQLKLELGLSLAINARFHSNISIQYHGAELGQAQTAQLSNPRFY
jgi:hypothetical protein